MNKNPINAVPITIEELKTRREGAQNVLREVTYEVAREFDRNSATAYTRRNRMREDKVGIVDLVRGINTHDDLPSETELQVLRSIRHGLEIANHVADDFKRRAGVPDRASSSLTVTQKEQIREKDQTAAAIAVFIFAQYIIWDLRAVASEKSSTQTVNPHIGDMDYNRVTPALNGSVYFLGKSIEREVDGSGDRLISVVFKYADLLQQEVLGRIGAFKHVEFFTDLTYQVEESEFVIAGFDPIDTVSATSVEFNELRMEEIVGNRDAKHFARRLVERLLAYDFAEKKNPFEVFGGIAPVHMGYGIPGTGKSMLISAIATLLKERCEQLDVPFLFHPMPDTVVSTFQGGSAEHMVQWMKPLQDPTKIIFAPIDDAENNLQDRTMQGVSAGVREVIGVFLRYTEGAYAINHGNSAVGVYTNLPEQLDPAVLSRIQARFKIDGARTVNDIIDQDYIWWSKLEEALPGFVGMKNPAYAYLSDQAVVSNMGETYGDIDLPQEATIKDAYERTLRNHSPDEHAFFAQWYEYVQEAFPGFSSRDIRNIQKAVSYRIMDFDLPDEWYENPEVFFQQKYDVKVEMIRELMKANMGNLNFAEVRRQESIKYLDNLATIADADFKRKVESRIDEMKVMDAATRTRGRG